MQARPVAERLGVVSVVGRVVAGVPGLLKRFRGFGTFALQAEKRNREQAYSRINMVDTAAQPPPLIAHCWASRQLKLRETATQKYVYTPQNVCVVPTSCNKSAAFLLSELAQTECPDPALFPVASECSDRALASVCSTYVHEQQHLKL